MVIIMFSINESMSPISACRSNTFLFSGSLNAEFFCLLPAYNR